MSTFFLFKKHHQNIASLSKKRDVLGFRNFIQSYDKSLFIQLKI